MCPIFAFFLEYYIEGHLFLRALLAGSKEQVAGNNASAARR